MVVNVRHIAEMGAYVRLLEYDNIEGMILLSELSRKRIRSIQKLIRVGRNEVVVVLRVDKEKGYIDLSKRRVSPEDILKCEERFAKAKTVHSIMRNVAEKTDIPIEQVYAEVAWPLYRKYGHAYEGFRLSIAQQEEVFSDLTLSSPSILPEVIHQVSRRMTPQQLKLRADIEVTCFAEAGIDAIREALKAGEAQSTDESPIKIKLVAPPLYVVIAQTLDKAQGLASMDAAIEAITQCIQGYKGDLIVKMKPQSVSETDDVELSKLMERLEAENEERSGDEDEDEDDD